MKKLFLLLAVSGLILASCGKKAEPTPEPTPAPQETVAPAPTPAPTPAPAPTPEPTKKVTKAPEVKTVNPNEAKTAPTVNQTSKTAPNVKTAPAKPVERTLEEKIKHINEYSPEEQKAILKEAQQQTNTNVGNTGKTSKTKN